MFSSVGIDEFVEKTGGDPYAIVRILVPTGRRFFAFPIISSIVSNCASPAPEIIFDKILFNLLIMNT